MTRFIDMTDAQKGALHARMQAKEKARCEASVDDARSRLAAIEAEALDMERSGGRFAEQRAQRIRDEKQPIIDHYRAHGVELEPESSEEFEYYEELERGYARDRI